MKFFIFLVAFFLSMNSYVFGQNTFSVNYNFSAIDHFIFLTQENKCSKKMNFISGIGFPVRTTFIQKRICPMFQFGIESKNFIPRNSLVNFKWVLSNRLASYKLSSQTRLSYMELVSGINCSLGSKDLKLIFGFQLGRGWEFISGSSDLVFPYWAYSLRFGIGYEI